jgi:hypothetical protein
LLQTEAVPGTVLVQAVVKQTIRTLASIGQLPLARVLEQPQVFVGLDAVQSVVQLLASASSPQLVLLHGMGGIGKTTLATAVFNQLHAQDCTLPCSFLRLDPEVDLVQQQQQLLQDLSRTSDVTLRSAQHGRQLLEEALQGSKVLLVVDNVWRDQLESLLPGNIMEVLGGGSMVLVTSRDAAAVRGFGNGLVVEVQPLSKSDAMKLFCEHAFGHNSLHDSAVRWRQQVEEVVVRCGGVPMAVEAVGRCLGSTGRKQEFFRRMDVSVMFAYAEVKVGRIVREQTVFGVLQLSWDVLEAAEKEALLDIVWFLRGQPWELVGAYCAYGVLDQLRRLGLVQAVGDSVEVAAVVVDFCKHAASQGRQGQRQELQEAGCAGADAVASLLRQVCHICWALVMCQVVLLAYATLYSLHASVPGMNSTLLLNSARVGCWQTMCTIHLQQTRMRLVQHPVVWLLLTHFLVSSMHMSLLVMKARIAA